MITECGCQVLVHTLSERFEIVYCPLHAAAPLLREALLWLINLHHGISKGHPMRITDTEWLDAIEGGEEVLATAEGKEER